MIVILSKLSLRRESLPGEESKGIWVSRATGRVLCGLRIARLARFVVKLHYDPLTGPAFTFIIGASSLAATRQALLPNQFPYPFVLDRAILSLCALFFLCLLAILFSENLSGEDFEYPKAGPLGCVSVAIFSSDMASIQ